MKQHHDVCSHCSAGEENRGHRDAGWAACLYGTPHAGAVRLVISSRTQTFRKRFFPSVSAHDWNGWRWQLRHRIKDLDMLARIIHLSDDERTAITRHQGALPVGLNPFMPAC
jgi:hypothetical protein